MSTATADGMFTAPALPSLPSVPLFENLSPEMRKRLLITGGAAVGAAAIWLIYNRITYKDESVKEAKVVGVPKSEEALIAKLDPRMQPLARQFITEARAAGYRAVLTQGRRTIAEQNKLYAQGRTAPGKRVTSVKGGYSAHNYGMAIDFAFRDSDGSIYWPENGPWKEVAAFGKKLGLEWGGDWKKFVDRPHLELPGWRAMRKQWQAGTLKLA